MQILLITVCANSIKSFFIYQNFLKFCFKKVIHVSLNCKILQKFNKKKISLLKSPHVHKSAQEHFNQKLHKQKFLFFLDYNSYVKLFFLLKKLLNFSFYDVNIKIKSLFYKLEICNYQKFLSLNNYCFILNDKKYCNKFSVKTSKKKGFIYCLKKIIVWKFLKLLNLIGNLLKAF
jgi:ribosomal protein S10